jgi:hypothetical protein
MNGIIREVLFAIKRIFVHVDSTDLASERHFNENTNNFHRFMVRRLG